MTISNGARAASAGASRLTWATRIGARKPTAAQVAERLRTRIAEYPFAHREEHPGGCVSVSIGVAGFPEDAQDAEAPRSEGLGNALVFVTTLLLLGAFLVMHVALNDHFSVGLFGGN